MKVPISSQIITMTHALVSKTLFPTVAPGAAGPTSLAPGLLFHTLGTVNQSDLGPLTMTMTTLPGGAGDGTLDGGVGGGMGSVTSDGAGVPVPSLVRAHAYVALGKLCLRDGALAKKVQALFGVCGGCCCLLVVVVVVGGGVATIVSICGWNGRSRVAQGGLGP